MASNEAGDALGCIWVPYGNLASAIEAHETVVDPVQLADRPRTWWIDELLDAALAKDVDLAWTELGLVRTNCEEGLYGFIGETAEKTPPSG